MADDNYISLIRIKKSVFVSAYGDDAVVLSNVTDYKLKVFKNGKKRCGFPFSGLGAVMKKLEDARVSYVFSGDNEDGKGSRREHLLPSEENQYHVFLSMVPSGEEDLNIGDKRLAGYKSSEYQFVDSLCMGKDPYTGHPIRMFDLTLPENLRWLFLVREKLKGK